MFIVCYKFLVFTLGNQPGLAVHPSSKNLKKGIESKLGFVKLSRKQRFGKEKMGERQKGVHESNK